LNSLQEIPLSDFGKYGTAVRAALNRQRKSAFSQRERGFTVKIVAVPHSGMTGKRGGPAFRNIFTRGAKFHYFVHSFTVSQTPKRGQRLYTPCPLPAFYFNAKPFKFLLSGRKKIVIIAAFRKKRYGYKKLLFYNRFGQKTFIQNTLVGGVLVYNIKPFIVFNKDK
jgi:hypothetical protein